MNIADIRSQYPQYSDMSDADLASALHQKFYADMPYSEFAGKIGLTQAPQEKPPVELAGGSITNKTKATLPFTGRDVAMGARQVIDAGAQMLTRGLEKIPAISDFMRGQRENVEAVNQQALEAYKAKGEAPYAAIGRGLGQAGVTAPMVALKAPATIAGLVGQGAMQGGAANALTPIYGAGDDFWAKKAEQAKEGAQIGALTAGGLGVGAKILSPAVRPAARAMLDEGITPTPGQILGGPLKTLEEKATSIPGLGDAIRSSQGKALNEYNVALYNRILRSIGEKYEGPAGQQGIAAVGDKLSAAYDDALSKSVPNVVSDSFRARMSQLSQMVPQSKRQDFVSVVNKELQVTPGNTITPSVAKGAESEFARLARQYKGSAIADEREFAQAMEQARANVRELVAQNNPKIAPRIRDIDRAYSDLVQLENAANSTKVARAEGLVTPSDQLRGIKKSDPSIRDRRFARGEMPNQDFAQMADSVLSNKYPDSGSIGRLLVGGGLLSGGAAISPAVAIGGAMGTLPYLPGGRQAAAALLARRPGLVTEVGDTVKALAPYLAAPAAGLLSPR